MTMPVVQLDVDGVLADFVGGSLAVMRELGYNFEHHHVTEWNIERLLPESLHEEFWRRLKQPGFCAGLAVREGAQELVTELLFRDFDVRFLTSPMRAGNPHWEPERRAWLERHFAPAFGGGDVLTFAKEKHSHPGDYLVDDKPEHCEAWARTERVALLVDHPYNRHFDDEAPDLMVFRARGLADVITWLDSLEE